MVEDCLVVIQVHNSEGGGEVLCVQLPSDDSPCLHISLWP